MQKNWRDMTIPDTEHDNETDATTGTETGEAGEGAAESTEGTTQTEGTQPKAQKRPWPRT